ncbi:MAG: NAD(+)/NADH kinase, partial [bacterium]|nr:NAD(+)/NADH kinase [bacterium]
ATKTAGEVKTFLTAKGVKLVKSKPDFTIVIGGDGTILYHKEKLEGPVFAIGSKKSFVCQCLAENWKDGLSSFLSKPNYEERMLLEVKHKNKKYTAINDLALLSQQHEMLTLSVDIGGDEYCFDADGIVVSTPTGSTAYAYASGGSVIEPTLEIFNIVPVAPDKRLFDPVVVSASHKLVLTPYNPAHFIVDGGKPMKVKKGEKITITKSRKKIKFAVR